MLDMQIPWWEFIVRASIVYIALLAMVRLTGKRTVGQFTPFDLIVAVLEGRPVLIGRDGEIYKDVLKRQG